MRNVDPTGGLKIKLIALVIREDEFPVCGASKLLEGGKKKDIASGWWCRAVPDLLIISEFLEFYFDVHCGISLIKVSLGG